MYSLIDHGGFLSDTVRMRAYERALEKAVRPESVVLDIGTGTGIHALLACQFGARRVFAVEPDDVIEIAREMAASNGYADRITFIQDLSTNITLPERADVIVSDLRGVLPLLAGHIPAIIDARTRHLAQGGLLIPKQDTLFAAPVNAAAPYESLTSPWNDRSAGLDLTAPLDRVLNSWRKVRVRPDQLLAPPQAWAQLNYETIDSAPIAGEASWTLEAAGVAHGIAIWFDAELHDGIGFSNAPGAPDLIYGSAFFPFREPLALNDADTVCVTLSATPTDGNYTWLWNTVVRDGGHHREKWRLRQSTFQAGTWTAAKLRRRAACHVPVLNADGRAERAILDRMDGTQSLGDIAAAVMKEYPSMFADRQEALSRVTAVSARYSA